MEIKDLAGNVLFALESAKTVLQSVKAAVDAKKSLRGADLSGADLSGKKIHSLRVFSGLYDYQVWAVLFKDGTRAIRMGCFFKTLDEWKECGIALSNLSEFPDDGSLRSKERIIAFEFARDAALRMVLSD